MAFFSLALMKEDKPTISKQKKGKKLVPFKSISWNLMKKIYRTEVSWAAKQSHFLFLWNFFFPWKLYNYAQLQAQPVHSSNLVLTYMEVYNFQQKSDFMWAYM
jgi:hypothetical protein